MSRIHLCKKVNFVKIVTYKVLSQQRRFAHRLLTSLSFTLYWDFSSICLPAGSFPCNCCCFICLRSSVAFQVLSEIHLYFPDPLMHSAAFSAAMNMTPLKWSHVSSTSSTDSRTANLLCTSILNASSTSDCLLHSVKPLLRSELFQLSRCCHSQKAPYRSYSPYPFISVESTRSPSMF